MLLLLALTSACGSALLITQQAFSARDLPRLRRGALALGCHERHSGLFPLFFVCPGDSQALGIAASDGMLSISCPDLRPRLCRKLFERVSSASKQPAPPLRAPPDAAAEPVPQAVDAGADAEPQP